VISAIWDEGFKRSYRKKIQRLPYLRKKFREKLEMFLDNPYAPQLRMHRLSGKLSGQWVFSIDGDYRVIFEFVSEGTVMLIDFGTHEEVY
jgi:addiction module RelE/StbE family toxin